MGIYIYTARKQIKTCTLKGVGTPIALLKFLQRTSYVCYGEREKRLGEARLERAGQCWHSLEVRPQHVALGDKFEEGTKVFEWDSNEHIWYDCDNAPLGKLMGFLRRVRKGRRVEWVVVPQRYEIQVMHTPSGRGLHSRTVHAWTREEAVYEAQKFQNTVEGITTIKLRFEGEHPSEELFFESPDSKFDRELQEAPLNAGISSREIHATLLGN